MFASIPRYVQEGGGPEAMTALNEIFFAFDRLLISYPEVEKIKMIGSTYMCAVGLDFAMPDLLDIDDRPDAASGQAHLVSLTNFAFDMMVELEQLSHDLFCQYQLQVGIAYGEVVAGVIASEKPLYDIWGDTVNIASRMESQGVPGKIQVPSPEAEMLGKHGFVTSCRGVIRVKNHGMINTCLVDSAAAPKKRSSRDVDELGTGRLV